MEGDHEKNHNEWQFQFRFGGYVFFQPSLPTPNEPPLNLFGTIFFFFQAEDGIRDWSVTGVQTCALPIQAEDCIRDWSVTGVQTCALPIMIRHTRLVSDWSSDVCSSDLPISYAVFC